MKYIYFYQTKIEIIGIVTQGDFIVEVFYNKDIDDIDYDNYINKQTSLHKKAIKQLKKYLAGKLKEFTLPLNFQGSEFEVKVWTYLTTVPYANTKNYKEVAEAINNPKSYRAVGGACNKNPISIIVPCHRIIKSNGDLGGYAGGLYLKKKLLKLEKDNS